MANNILITSSILKPRIIIAQSKVHVVNIIISKLVNLEISINKIFISKTKSKLSKLHVFEYYYM